MYDAVPQSCLPISPSYLPGAFSDHKDLPLVRSWQGAASAESKLWAYVIKVRAVSQTEVKFALCTPIE